MATSLEKQDEINYKLMKLQHSAENVIYVVTLIVYLGTIFYAYRENGVWFALASLLPVISQVGWFIEAILKHGVKNWFVVFMICSSVLYFVLEKIPRFLQKKFATETNPVNISVVFRK